MCIIIKRQFVVIQNIKNRIAGDNTATEIAVIGGGSVSDCRTISQPIWLLDALLYSYISLLNNFT